MADDAGAWVVLACVFCLVAIGTCETRAQDVRRVEVTASAVAGILDAVRPPAGAAEGVRATTDLVEEPGQAEPASMRGTDLLHRARAFVLRRPDGPFRLREPGAEDEVRTVVRAAEFAADSLLPTPGRVGANWPDAPLLLSLAYRESRWRIAARGARGEVGLAQLHPRWHRGPLDDPEANLTAAATTLALGLRECGTEGRALRLYGSGRCGSPTRADRMVLRWATELRR